MPATKQITVPPTLWFDSEMRWDAVLTAKYSN